MQTVQTHSGGRAGLAGRSRRVLEYKGPQPHTGLHTQPWALLCALNTPLRK